MALTKKVMGAVVAIALILTTVLTFAFKAKEDTKTKSNPKLVVQQWYSITPTSSTDKNDQDITGSITAPPSTSGSGCAQINNLGNYCAVLLQFPGSSAPSLTGQNVQEAIDDNGATVVTGTASAGYSRSPL